MDPSYKHTSSLMALTRSISQHNALCNIVLYASDDSDDPMVINQSNACVKTLSALASHMSPSAAAPYGMPWLVSDGFD